MRRTNTTALLLMLTFVAGFIFFKSGVSAQIFNPPVRNVSPSIISVGVVAPVAPKPTSTTPYQSFINELEAQKKINTSTIGIQFFGDIMIDRNVAARMGKRGLDYIFEHVSPVGAGSPCPRGGCQGGGTPPLLFGAADLLIANLEGPFAPARVFTTKSIAFRFDPKWAPQFKKYGFTALSLANNHSLDMGSKNDAYTRKLLTQQGIGFFGKQYNEGPEFNWVWPPLLTKERSPTSQSGGEVAVPGAAVSVPSNKIAFVGLEFVGRKLNMAKAIKAVKKAREDGRYVIAYVHAGDEYKRLSNTTQRTIYRQLIDQGADAVIAHHPHVIEEAEVYKGKPIFYSLGNFIFDQYFSKDTQEGLSVGLILQDGQIKSAHAIPFYSVQSQVFPMEGKRLEDFYGWLNKSSRLGEKKFKNGILYL